MHQYTAYERKSDGTLHPINMSLFARDLAHALEVFDHHFGHNYGPVIVMPVGVHCHGTKHVGVDYVCDFG